MNTDQNADPKESARWFAEKFGSVECRLDFSLQSLSSEVDTLLGSFFSSSSHSPAQWREEAGLEAYVGETMRQLFNGEWKGAFSPSNPGPNYYLSWVQFGEFKYFPSHFLGRRINNGEAETGTLSRHLDLLLPTIKLRGVKLT